MDLALTNISADWLELLKNDELSYILQQLDNKSITPSLDLIFEFSRLTPLNGIKVIIVGQDPYPKPGDAHGLSFSCLSGIPASLKNIYSCLLHHKLLNQMPPNGNLSSWARQGVLMLNRALTTEPNTANAHSELWSRYTLNLFVELSKMKPYVWFLWGNNAKQIKPHLDSHSVIYEWSHPSPLAVARQPFIPCDHFIKTKDLINWGSLMPPVKKQNIAFTDGSCYPNKPCDNALAGYAVVFAEGSLEDTVIYGNLDKVKYRPTNQRAEGMAIIRAIEYYKLKGNTDQLIIITDSEFWIKMLELYIPSWLRSGIDFDEKKNPDLIARIWPLYSNNDVELRHVKSHDKNKWSKCAENTYEYFCYVNNTYADELCGYARLNCQPGAEVIEQADY